MRAIFKRRLIKLAEHLERGQFMHEVFNFGVVNAGPDGSELVVNGCGTMGCAIGECPAAFPKSWHFKGGQPKLKSVPQKRSKSSYDRVANAFDSAEKFFGLCDEEASHLFAPGQQSREDYGGRYLRSDASPIDVAENIRAFIERKEEQEPA